MVSVRADYGGGPEHILRLAETLSDRVHIFMACPRDEPYDDRYKALLGQESVLNIPHRKFSILYFLRLMVWVQKQKIQVIHGHGKGAGIYGRLLGLVLKIPVVHTFHGLHHGAYTGVLRFLYLALERTLARRTSKLISVSKSELKLLENLDIGAEFQRQLIPNGVRFSTNPPLPFEMRSRPLRILTVTRFDEAKNPLLLFPILRALFAKNLEFQVVLDVVASPEGERDFMEEAKKQGLDTRINFLGLLPDLSLHYKDAACFLSTSLWEGLPLAVMEAMSFGVPVVASRVTGNIDLIESGSTGFLYDVKNPKEAADYILDVLGNSSLWATVSQQAQSRIREGFSLQSMATKTFSVYNEALQVSD
jgi:glycosyltransferase involved in cell wall biosynthesis